MRHAVPEGLERSARLVVEKVVDQVHRRPLAEEFDARVVVVNGEDVRSLRSSHGRKAVHA